MLATAHPNLFDPLEDTPPSGAQADDTTSSTRTGPAHVLYRCRYCEQSTKHTHVWRQTFTRTTATRAWWNPTMGREVRLPEITWTDAHGTTTRGEQAPVSPCGTCRRPTSGRPIQGRCNLAHRCDVRCLYAKGPDCECSCGGKNHGAGHRHQ
jgi:hypothetical protein